MSFNESFRTLLFVSLLADDDSVPAAAVKEVMRTCVRDTPQEDLEQFREFHEARTYYEQAKANARVPRRGASPFR